MAISKESLLDLSKKLISLRNNKVDLSTGSVLSDVGVDSTAQILASISEDIDRVVNQQALNPEYFTDEEADMFVQPFGLVRLGATYATGVVTFATNTLPSSSSPIFIPSGTTVYGSPDGTAQFSYTTTNDVYLTQDASFNNQTGYYEVSVPIKAVLPGSQSNLGIGYINNLSTSISGISAVYNKDSILNGSDIETTADLLDRFILLWKGRNRNTEPGILAWTYSNPSVEEAIVVGPNSEYSLRGPGAVDVYIRGVAQAQYTQTVTQMVKEVYLDKCPVINADTSMSVNLNGVTYTPSDGYFKFVKDTTTIFQSSSSARDKIVWTDDGYELIKNLESYTITYYYNSMVTDLQSMFDNDESRLITGDILVRTTQLTYVTMEFGITPDTGYDKNSTITLVKNNIQSFINKLPLNTPIRQSDIINIIETTEGVSYTKLPFLKFCKKGETEESKLVADIDSTPLEYFRILADDIIVG